MVFSVLFVVMLCFSPKRWQLRGGIIVEMSERSSSGDNKPKPPARRPPPAPNLDEPFTATTSSNALYDSSCIDAVLSRHPQRVNDGRLGAAQPGGLTSPNRQSQQPQADDAQPSLRRRAKVNPGASVALELSAARHNNFVHPPLTSPSRAAGQQQQQTPVLKYDLTTFTKGQRSNHPSRASPLQHSVEPSLPVDHFYPKRDYVDVSTVALDDSTAPQLVAASQEPEERSTQQQQQPQRRARQVTLRDRAEVDDEMNKVFAELAQLQCERRAQHGHPSVNATGPAVIMSPPPTLLLTASPQRRPHSSPVRARASTPVKVFNADGKAVDSARMFRETDRDADGWVTAMEVQSIMRREKICNSARQVQNAFNAVKSPQRADIDRSEFQHLLSMLTTSLYDAVPPADRRSTSPERHHRGPAADEILPAVLVAEGQQRHPNHVYPSASFTRVDERTGDVVHDFVDGNYRTRLTLKDDTARQREDYLAARIVALEQQNKELRSTVLGGEQRLSRLGEAADSLRVVLSPTRREALDREWALRRRDEHVRAAAAVVGPPPPMDISSLGHTNRRCAPATSRSTVLFDGEELLPHRLSSASLLHAARDVPPTSHRCVVSPERRGGTPPLWRCAPLPSTPNGVGDMRRIFMSPTSVALNRRAASHTSTERVVYTSSPQQYHYSAPAATTTMAPTTRNNHASRSTSPAPTPLTPNHRISPTRRRDNTETGRAARPTSLLEPAAPTSTAATHPTLQELAYASSTASSSNNSNGTSVLPPSPRRIRSLCHDLQPNVKRLLSLFVRKDTKMNGTVPMHVAAEVLSQGMPGGPGVVRPADVLAIMRCQQVGGTGRPAVVSESAVPYAELVSAIVDAANE